MDEPSKKLNAKTPMPEKICLRRGPKIVRNYSTRLLFQAIKDGKLLATDEYSLDGQHWVKLGSHRQLEKYLNKEPSAVDTPTVSNNETVDQNSEESGSLPPGLNDDLQKLADMLKSLNSDS